MASLSDTLLKNKSGQLYKTSDEELKKLATGAGLPAAPVSPMSAGGIGANPDQAKMAGVSNQKVTALRDSIQGSNPSLDDALKQNKQQQAVTPSDAANKVAGLQGLTSLETRVDELKNKAIQQATQAATQLPVALKAGVDASLSPLIQTLITNPNDQQAWVAINKKLGRQDGNFLTSQQIMDQYVDQSKSVPAAIAEPTLKSLSTADLQQMGYSSLADIEQLVGKPVADLTFTDFQNLVHEQLTQETGRTSDIKAMLSDPSLGAAERAQLQQELQQSGSTGEAATDAEAKALNDELASDLTVSFNGQEMSLQDALGSDQVSKWIKDYVSATPEEKAKLQASEPALAGYVDKHSSLMTDLTGKLTEGSTSFQTTQNANKKLAEVAPGVVLEDDVMKALIPGWGEASATVLTAPPLLRELSNSAVPAAQKQAVGDLLRQVSAISPELLTSLANEGVAKLQKLGLTDPSSPAYQDFITRVAPSYSAIKNLDVSNPAAVDQQSVANVLGFDSPAAAQQAFQTAKIMQNSGLFGNNTGLDKFTNLIGPTFDEDDWINIARTLKTSLPATSTVDNLAAGLNGQGWMALPGMAGDFNSYQGETTSPYVKYLSDGKLDHTELKDIGATLTDPKTFDAFLQSPMYQALPNSDKVQFKAGAVNAARDQINTMLGQPIEKLGTEIANAPAGYAFSSLKDAIQRLRDTSSTLNPIAKDEMLKAASGLEAQMNAVKAKEASSAAKKAADQAAAAVAREREIAAAQAAAEQSLKTALSSGENQATATTKRGAGVI